MKNYDKLHSFVVKIEDQKQGTAAKSPHKSRKADATGGASGWGFQFVLLCPHLSLIFLIFWGGGVALEQKFRHNQEIYR